MLCNLSAQAGVVYGPPAISDPSQPLVEDKDCIITRTGITYDGYRNTTITGRQCQRWDQNTPQVSHVETFRISGPLWGESTGDRWIPLTKGK